MTDDADKEAAEALAALKAKVARLVAEKFGSDEIYFDLDDMLIYHDVRQVLQTPNIQTELEEIIASAADESEVVARLSTLNHQIEGLRRVFYAASHEQTEEICTSLAREAFLDEAEITRLRELVGLYASALQRVESPEEVGGINPDTEAILRCLTDELITPYLENFYTSKRWLANTLFQFSKIELGPPPGTWMQFLFDEAHYTALIPLFERIKEPFLADIARLAISFKHILAGGLTQPIVAEIQQIVTRLDHYDPAEFTILDLVSDFAGYLHNAMRIILGMDSSIPLSDRLTYLERAEQYFDRRPEFIFQMFGPVLHFHRAQLLQASEREKLELSAVNRLHELLVQCVLQQDPTERVWGMAILMMLPAGWKLSKGDFRGAAEFAMMAKALARAALKLFQDYIHAFSEEVEKELARPDITPEERKMALSIHETLPQDLLGIESLAQAPDLAVAISHAKLAEAQGDFSQAAEIYQEAAHIQKEMMDHLRSTIESFRVVMQSRKDLYYELEFEATATYFHGMASLNSGDQHLIEGDYAAAKQSYSNAQLTFETTASLWAREAEGPPVIMPEKQSKAHREQNISTLRIRYCDAKLEIADAEQYSALRLSWQSAKHFEKAAGIFSELLESAVFKDESRNVEILKASEDYCRGRWLLEMDRSAKRQDNVEEGCSRLDWAALRFEQCSETRWAGYIEGLRYEYEAASAWELATTSLQPNTATPYMQLAQSKAHDAAVIFRQMGAEKRARYLEGWARMVMSSTSYTFPRIVLPKALDLAFEQNPSETLIAQLIGRQQITPEKQDPMEDQLHRLQARATALSRRLDDIRDRRDRGRIDEGQYTDLASDLDRERIEILQSVRRVLQGRDIDLDAILRGAVSGEQEAILMDQLAQMAQKKGLDQSTVEALNKHQGSLVFWLIEIGMQLMKQANQK